MSAGVSAYVNGPAVSAASVGMAVLAFVVGMILDHVRKTNGSLQEHLGRAAGASGIPSAIILVCAAFDPTILTQISGLNVPIAFGGMSLFYISLKALLSKATP